MEENFNQLQTALRDIQQDNSRKIERVRVHLYFIKCVTIIKEQKIPDAGRLDQETLKVVEEVAL